MWNKSIGVILLLKIASVSIRGDDNAATDSRTYKSVDWVVKKEYKLIFEEVSWYTANLFCVESGMQLASINSFEEQQRVENLIKHKYMVDQPFWITNSLMAVERTSKSTNNEPTFLKRESTNQCTSWLWKNAELCVALWPLANEWSHGDCNERRKFICEQRHESENEMFKAIEDELLALVDDNMLTGFAEALSTTTKSTWISLVKGALHMWLMEQQQILKATSLLDDQVNKIAAELVQIGGTLHSDELRNYVNRKFEAMEHEDRVPLLSERFRKFIGDEYLKLEAGAEWTNSPSDEIIVSLVRKVIMMAKIQEIQFAREELSKISESVPSDVLDEEHLKVISQQLIKFSEHEFHSYVQDVMGHLESLGVEEVDMNMLLQLYLLVKQELFSVIAKTVFKATSKERVEITNFGLSRILEGKQLIEDDSVFGQIFVVLATGTAALAEEKSVHALDDVLIREFVKNEFQGLSHENMLKLKYEGYIKFIIDEIIKLVSDINFVKSDSGELLLNNVVDLIATQFLLYAEDEMKIIAERLAKSDEEETNKLQTIGDEIKIKLPMYDDDKLRKLFQMVEQEMFTFAAKTLVHFTEKEMLELAEEGLSKILAEDIFKWTERRLMFGRVFVAIGEEFSKLTKDEFANLKDEELVTLVKLEFAKTNYEKNIDLFEEVFMKIVAGEFINLIEQEAVMLSAHEEEVNQFGETVRFLAIKMLDIAKSEPVM